MARCTTAPLKYTLELNEEEAKALLAVLELVSGDPYRSSRYYIDDIYDALTQQNIFELLTYRDLVQGNIEFRDFRKGCLVV